MSRFEIAGLALLAAAVGLGGLFFNNNYVGIPATTVAIALMSIAIYRDRD